MSGIDKFINTVYYEHKDLMVQFVNELKDKGLTDDDSYNFVSNIYESLKPSFDEHDVHMYECIFGNPKKVPKEFRIENEN